MQDFPRQGHLRANGGGPQIEKIFQGGSNILTGAESNLKHPDLPLYEAIGFGEVGEEVMWLMCWHCRNCSNSLDVKGGPLSM